MSAKIFTGQGLRESSATTASGQDPTSPCSAVAGTNGLGHRSATGTVASQESTSGRRSVNWRCMSSTVTHTMTLEESRRRALIGLDLVTAAILGCVERRVGALDQGLRGVLGPGLG